MAKKNSIFNWQPFSDKQIKLLTWWMPDVSPFADYDGVIAEGSIRAGKTVAMIDSFVTWSNQMFDGENFILCGKTIGALKRNVLNPMFRILDSKGIKYKYVRSDDPRIEIGNNIYYIFGGDNEKSQDKVQGLTAAGAFLDEVALMPKSFVEQVVGRCSVDGSKYFFNCNPGGPYHWFKLEWIDQAEEKRLICLHFTMDDNLSLSQKVKDRLKRMFTGVFFQRFILGLWVMAEGVIYDMFQDDVHKIANPPATFEKYYVGVDYGTANPCVFLLLGKYQNNYYLIKEYYYDGRNHSRQKTDAEYSRDLKDFIKDYAVAAIFIDPSAKSFITQLRQDGVVNINEADNSVNDGIRTVSTWLSDKKLFIHESCVNTLTEFTSYVWDVKAQKHGEDKPLKENDHAMDALRYVVFNISKGFSVWTDYIQEEYTALQNQQILPPFPESR